MVISQAPSYLGNIGYSVHNGYIYTLPTLAALNTSSYIGYSLRIEPQALRVLYYKQKLTHHTT